MRPREKDQRRKFITETSLETGVVVAEKYVLRERLHRNPAEGPACIERFDNGAIQSIEYFVQGKHHREDGPAFMMFAANGIAIEEYHSIAGKIHRDPEMGPAFVQRNEQGRVTSELYSSYDVHWRNPAKGPYSVRWGDDGTVEREEYSKPDEEPPRPTEAFKQRLRQFRRKATL